MQAISCEHAPVGTLVQGREGRTGSSSNKGGACIEGCTVASLYSLDTRWKNAQLGILFPQAPTQSVLWAALWRLAGEAKVQSLFRQPSQSGPPPSRVVPCQKPLAGTRNLSLPFVANAAFLAWVLLVHLVPQDHPT